MGCVRRFHGKVTEMDNQAITNAFSDAYRANWAPPVDTVALLGPVVPHGSHQGCVRPIAHRALTVLANEASTLNRGEPVATIDAREVFSVHRQTPGIKAQLRQEFTMFFRESTIHNSRKPLRQMDHLPT